MSRTIPNQKIITTTVTAAVLILSLTAITLVGWFVWRAIEHGAAQPTGVIAKQAQSVNMELLEKSLDTFAKKASAPPIAGEVKNPFAFKTTPTGTPSSVQ